MSRATFGLASVLVSLLLPRIAAAQVPGDLDPTFGTGGAKVIDVRVNGDPRGSSASGLALQSDGKIVLAGSATLISGSTGPERMVAVRLTTAGALDGSFGAGGVARIDGLTNQTDEGYYDGRVAIGPDGGIFLFNGTLDAGNVLGWVVAKLAAANGALVNAWDGDGRLAAEDTELEAGDIATQPDGKVIVFDDWFDASQTPDNQQVSVGRRLAGGGPDSGFGVGGWRDFGFDLGGSLGDFARVAMVQSDGKILVGGRAEIGTGTNPPSDFFVARLTTAGALDPTFGGGDGKVTVSFDLPYGNADEARALAVDASGRIYAGGTAGNFSTASDCALVRLLPDGTPDPSFGGGDGKVTFPFASPNQGAFDQIFGLALQGNGRVVVAGRGTNAAGTGRTIGVARLTSTGALDPTFAGDGTVVYNFATGTGTNSVGRAVALAQDGRIVVSGFTQQASGDNDFVAARLWNDYIFADGLESASTAAWSAVQP